jgi:flagellar protein FliO/FliZ
MNYSPEMTTTAIKMVLSLLLVLAMVWGLYRLARRGLGPGAGSSNGRQIQVLANHYLGVKKSIALVQVPGSILVLGISADRVNLLSRINDTEVIANLNSRNSVDVKSGFRDQLQRILHPMNTGWKPVNKEK